MFLFLNRLKAEHWEFRRGHRTLSLGETCAGFPLGHEIPCLFWVLTLLSFRVVTSLGVDGFVSDSLRVTSSCPVSLKRRRSIPSGERRGGGSPARSRICRAVSAGPGGSCWTRPCNAPGSRRPCGDTGRGRAAGQGAAATGDAVLQAPPARGEPPVPLHLRAPQDVLLLVHEDGEVLVLALLDGVGAGGDSSHFAELKEATARHTRGNGAPRVPGRTGPPSWDASATVSPLHPPETRPLQPMGCGTPCSPHRPCPVRQG